MSGIHVTCALCEQELTAPGGLLITPPSEQRSGDTFTVEKVHICVTCWEPMSDALLALHLKLRPTEADL